MPELELISTLSTAPFALWEQDDGRLILAATDGLSVCVEGVVAPLASGPIDAATRGPDGHAYCTSGDRVLRLDPDGSGELEDITSAFAGHPQGRRGINCTGYGEIWVEGCSTRRLVDGSFAPTPAFHAAKSAPPTFPPAAALVDMHGCHWTLSTRERDRQLFFLPADAGDAWQIAWLEAGQWDFLIADSVGYIWVAGAHGWRRFCPRRAENGWQDVGGDLPSTEVSALALSPDDLVLAAFSGGELLELNADANGGTRARALATLPGPARCIHTGRDGAIWIATDDGLYRREPEADAWQRNWEQKRGRLPVGGNHDIFAAECLGRLWVAGGWACAWGFPVRNYVGDELFAYDWQSEYWQIVSHMYMPRRYNGIAELEDRIWIVGGETCFPGRSGEEQALYIVDVYDPASDTWSAGPALNYVRTDPFVVSCNGRIYAIGGAGHNSGPKLDTVESIGPGETGWRLEPPLPEPTRQGHACVLDGVIYCLSIDGVFAFDTDSGRWDEALPQPGAIGQGPLAAAYRGEVWLIGGHGDQSIRCFNPETRTWRSGPDLPTEQAWGAAAVMNGRLLVVGGAHGSEVHQATVYDDRTYVLRDPGGSRRG